MTQTNTDAAIRGISLARRVGSVITFFVLTALSLLLLMQIMALISELKNVNKPIETPAYLKK